MSSNDNLSLKNFQRDALNYLNSIVKKQTIDIEFIDLEYSVRNSYGNTEKKCLLNSINGKFCSGELTAILGPSGSGKSTLLNILSGYITVGVKGTININNETRQLKFFNKLSSYIMQEDLVQPYLTVYESMIFVANLKLPSYIEQQQKIKAVNEILNLLGLVSCQNTRSDYLSDGEKKRFIVALELINNPPVIFLDEPTSGLDNYSMKQCMKYLRKISKLGRTIICTIHQPSSSLFQSFDQVYFLANGNCVYNGAPSNIVSFLSTLDFICPQNYDPADYIIELSHSDDTKVNILSNQIQQGKINLNLKKINHDLNIINMYEDTNFKLSQESDYTFSTSFYLQFTIILKRMLLQIIRNKKLIYVQLLTNIILGILISLLYYNIGNKASQMINIYKFLFGYVIYFMYMHGISTIVSFPSEVQLIKREYFNRWYSLKAYILAQMVATTPLTIISSTLFIVITYIYTDQPLEWDRFMSFLLLCLLLCSCSQSFGYAIGSIFNIIHGIVIGSTIFGTHIIICFYGMDYKGQVGLFMEFLYSINFLRYSLNGLCLSVFHKRPPLECDETYCHYTHPHILLNDMGISRNILNQFIGILLINLVLRLMTYFCLKYISNLGFFHYVINLKTYLINFRENRQKKPLLNC